MDFNIDPYLDCIPERMSVENVRTIANKESSHHPYALNIDGVGSFFPDTLDEAVALVVFYQQKRMDIGYMQISSSNAPALNIDPIQLLHPCDNIRIGSSIFLNFFDRMIDQKMSVDDATIRALSAYNTGDPVNGITNGYVLRYMDH